ncbi:hypothetical protein ABGB18_11405 [Nonomuraea sp. B12E4]|uniref:hypothetical protein n=1 Tax=Nonomuraea sp. B12E4 TaxID=3153564 RepID=UPI00325D76B6
MISKALRILRRTSARRERVLAAELARAFVERDEALREVAAVTAGEEETPQPITQALRSPKGKDRLVVVRYDGMTIKAVLHPIGRRNAEREAAVWRCLRDTAIAERDRRRGRHS